MGHERALRPQFHPRSDLAGFDLHHGVPLAGVYSSVVPQFLRRRVDLNWLVIAERFTEEGITGGMFKNCFFLQLRNGIQHLETLSLNTSTLLCPHHREGARKNAGRFSIMC